MTKTEAAQISNHAKKKGGRAAAPATAAKKPYPPSQSERSGNKVAWYTYTRKADAEIAAAAARHNAAIMAEQGFDFGYQVPGRVEKTAAGYVVVIP